MPSQSLSPFDLRDPVDWESRLAFEGPLLERTLAATPSTRILDLGCATGEHCRWLADRSFSAVGIDASGERLEAARRRSGSHGVEYVQGEIGAVEAGVRGHFGGALLLGNTLPQLLGTEAVARMAVGLRRRLLPGAPLVIQLRNFERIYARRQQSLPLIVDHQDDGSDRVCLRLLDLRPDDIVTVSVSELLHRPGEETPVDVLSHRVTALQAWRREELGTILDVARFPRRELYGAMDARPFHPIESEDLVIVAR